MIKTTKSPVPANEEKRLAEVEDLQILDTPHEKIYDCLAALASEVCEAPVSAITLIDKNRQWFKAVVGVEIEQISRDVAFCSHAIMQTTPMIVEDATIDARFQDNLMVRSGLKIRFYAGVPLITRQGFAVGTVCVIDNQKRSLDAQQTLGLQIIAKQISVIMELGKKSVKSSALREQILEQVNEKLHNLTFLAKNKEQISQLVLQAQELLGTMK